MKLQSYVADAWIAPEGNRSPIASAVTGESVAETGTTVRDFGGDARPCPQGRRPGACAR